MPKSVRARPALDDGETRKGPPARGARHAPGDWIERARIIALSRDGLTVTAIAGQLGCHPNRVRRWLHRFNEAGLDGLGGRPGAGRRRRITEAQRSVINAATALRPGIACVAARERSPDQRTRGDHGCVADVPERVPGGDNQSRGGFPMTDVYLLWHISHALRDERCPQHLDEDGAPLCDEQAGDDAKLLGVYSSEAAAQARTESARLLPGFRDEPDCFQIALYTVDKHEWAEGFAIINGDLPAPGPAAQPRPNRPAIRSYTRSSSPATRSTTTHSMIPHRIR